jgi:hypothetical protein
LTTNTSSQSETRTTTSRIPQIALVAFPALVALFALGATTGSAVTAVAHHPAEIAVFAAVTVALQATSFSVFGSSISVSGLGMLTVGFVFGTATAMLVAVFAALVHMFRKHPKPHKAIFNCACFVLATGAGVSTYEGLGKATPHASPVVLATAGSCVFLAVNTGLLGVAIAISEHEPVLPTWRSRLGWLSPAYIAFGPLAFLAADLHSDHGLGAIVALSIGALLSVALLRISLRSVPLTM